MDRFIKYGKASLWVLLELGIFVIITGLISSVLAMISVQILQPGPSIFEEEAMLANPYSSLLIEYLPMLMGATAALFITHTMIFKRDFKLTGFQQKNILKEFGQGYLLAFVMLSIGFGLLYIFGLIEIEQLIWNPHLFIGFFCFFLVQSAFEEMVSRSFMLPMISERINVIVGLLVSSAIFSIIHAFNPNVSWISLINIFLAGVLMGLLFLKSGRIWAPIGLHAGWNFLQGSFFGFEVSGFDVYSLIDSKEVGNDIITGGAFGFEGSILSLFLLAGISYWLIKQKPEMLTINNQTNLTDDEADYNQVV